MKTEDIFKMLGDLDEKMVAKASEDLERHRFLGQSYRIEEKEKFSWKRLAITAVCTAAAVFGVFFAVKTFSGREIPYYPGGQSETSDDFSSDTSDGNSSETSSSETSSTSSDTSSTSSDTSSTSSDTSSTSSDTSSITSEPAVPEEKPVYDAVFKGVNIPGVRGPALHYEEIVNSLKPDPDYPEYDTDSLYLVEVIKALSPEESKNVAGWKSDKTLYSVKILTNLDSGETINKIANVSATSGTVEYQEPGDPPYAPGERFTAALTKPYEGRDYLSADYMFRYDVVEENGKTMLYSRGSDIDEQNLPTSEDINEEVITSTTQNPAEYTQKLELSALVDFWRQLQKDLIFYSETEFDRSSPYPYQEALNSGRITPDAPKLDLATAKKIIAEHNDHYEGITYEFEEVQPYADYVKNTGITYVKYCPTQYEVISVVGTGEIDYVRYNPDGTIKSGEVLFKSESHVHGYDTDPNQPFLFERSWPSEEIKRGGEITVDIDMVNNSGKPYVFEGSESQFRPEVKLYNSDNSDNGGEYVIPYEPIPDTGETGRYEMAPGEVRTFTYRFKIPEDAPTGGYSIKMSYENSENSGSFFYLSD